MPTATKKTTRTKKAAAPRKKTATVRKRTTTRKSTAQPPQRQQLSKPLGLEGWEALDPIILAALASEEPLLLIGRHGTAKSFLLERLARALDLEFRFYNASLVNYDDLVGFPIPDESNASLKYIGTPSSIWDAEVVFLDEINRTRPELQNKLFPIVHERRVQGLKLKKLRYRWAAMNPPPDGNEDEADAYLGAEPLDPALADRFAFIVPVPTWGELNKTARKHILQDQYAGEHPFETTPAELVEKARRAFLALKTKPPEALAEYIIAVEKSFGHKGGYLSARRLTNLHRNILAVHAARVVIEGHPPARKTRKEALGDWEESAYLALLHSLPGTAQDGKVRKADLFAIHKHAWEICRLEDGNAWKAILDTPDPLDRLVVAHGLREKLEDFDLGKIILEALPSRFDEMDNRRAVALAAYLAFSRDRDIPATVVETLAKELDDVLVPFKSKLRVRSATVSEYRKIASFLTGLDRKVESGCCSQLLAGYIRNLLYAANNQRVYAENRVEEYHKFFAGLWARLDLDNANLEEPLPSKETA